MIKSNQLHQSVVSNLKSVRYTGSIILCFVSDKRALRFIDPMPRYPEPEAGFLFDSTFSDRLDAALELNSAIHDGAIVFEKSETDGYSLFAWSCRLAAPQMMKHHHYNHGSAFNSSLATSFVQGVDAVFLSSIEELWSFRNGEAFCEVGDVEV